ncbi:phenylalanine--tRNA ligase subunit beta [bacterium]|nr:phenylalanine--tRNA ligase subunit beta [bacterium]
MKISYNWLGNYFDDKLPPPEKIAEILTLRAYEVESISRQGDDFIFEIDILPNRAHDSLSHKGVARELATLLNSKLKIQNSKPQLKTKNVTPLSISIEDRKFCRRYIGRVIENVKVEQSLSWLAERLAAIGQKPINNIVDALNFVMFDMGQPMHAFDAGKLAGREIMVRGAKQGEHMTTLDNKDVAFDEGMFAIADESDPLALAGVKGGKKAEVNEGTTTIILEAANFHPTMVRKAAQGAHIRTDSSKRFENEIHPSIAKTAMEEATRLILEMCPEARVGDIIDEFPAENSFSRREIAIGVAEINNKLGTVLSPEDIGGILDRFGWEYRLGSDRFVVIPPAERLDIAIPEDLVEEIGRVHGYENIASTLPDVKGFTPKVNKEFYYVNKIRDILIGEGFSEIKTSSFWHTGDIAVANPIAEDKSYLRKNLAGGVYKALDFNQKNAPLFGGDTIKIFEIGIVFDDQGEHLELALVSGKGSAHITMNDLFEKMGAEIDVTREAKAGSELSTVNLTEVIKKFPEKNLYDFQEAKNNGIKYKRFSSYPFVVRDIALFAPEGVKPEDISGILLLNAGELLVRPPRLFDTFQKQGSGKVSYAFRLVFQSYEKTLTDEEVNEIMQKIISALVAGGFEVR